MSRCFALLLVVLCMAPTRAPGTAPAPATRPADSIESRCRRLLSDWKLRLDKAQMNVLISPPYVIAGDGSRQQLERYRDHTILAATGAMQSTLFDKKLDQPVLILLFESGEPYQRLSKQWFNDVPDTPFGYFRRDGIMVMNVGTGTGTLVHELTHALIKPDFPDVPDWLNEGLGSLYEQCSIDDDTIHGLPNWRLGGLQRAIKTNKLRPLSELIADPHFYGDEHVGMNYAQARYLLLRLQNRNQLPELYRRMRDHHDSDPTGIKTLQALIEPKTLDEFEKDWRQWVMGLRYP